MATFLFTLMCVISISQSFLAAIFIIALLMRLRKREKTVCIIVLGDIGRSPRMQYHAQSMLLEGYQVTLIGYQGSPPIASLQNNVNVSFIYLMEWPKKLMICGALNYIFKALFLTFQLIFKLFLYTNPEYFIVQNPPTIPSLSTIWLISRIKGSTFVIDWHNYGYTILSMNINNKKHLLVKFAKWYEGAFGSFSDSNICVTNAMKDDLKVKWNIDANVLYDKPPEMFQEITDQNVKKELFLKLLNTGLFKEFECKSELYMAICNLCQQSDIPPKSQPAVVISSTSWTEDEDFSLLLNALEIYEAKKLSIVGKDLPPLVCIITGKGPLKEHYQNLIQKAEFKHIAVITPWLSAEDYPKVIGTGDLGICLHYSSSGLDLPMKVVDMFGCCLPVCAVSFSCLDELVKHNENGCVFENSDVLAEQIIELLSGFPYCNMLFKFRNNIRNGFQKDRWHDNWKKVMLPILEKKIKK